MGDVLQVDEPGLFEAYAAWSETYDTIPNALLHTEEPVVRSLLVEIPRGRALDAGTGTGRYASFLSELGHEVIAVDASQAMLGRAQSKGLRTSLVGGELSRLPVQDGSMDLIICALALTHIRDLGATIAELGRVVRKGGAIVISDVHPVAVATGAQAMFKKADGSRGVALNLLRWPSEYVNAFVAAGLDVVHAAEPVVDRAFVEEIGGQELRAAAGASLLGLPLLLVWVLRKR